MKKAQWIDLFRGIKKSKGRYISLIFIVALGTAFFAGVRSAEPDMIASADKYYDESNLMDVRILGTLGLTEQDVVAIEATDGIVKAVIPRRYLHFQMKMKWSSMLCQRERI